MTRRNDVRDAAAETTHTAAERGAAILEQVLEALNPLIATASEKAESTRKQMAPLAEQAAVARERLTEQAKQTAATKVAPKVAPLAATAAVGAHKTKEQLQPHFDTVAEKVQPAAEQARQKVQEDLVPQLVDLLHQAENHPAVSEASKRSQAAAAALRGDLALPEKKKRSVGGTVAKVAAAGTLMAAAAVAVRQFLASKDDAWTAHQPSAAYRNEEPSDDAAAGSWVNVEEQGSDEVLDRAETEQGQDVPVQSDVVSDPDPQEQMSAEGGPVGQAETVAEDLAVLNTYGEGSYVGEEPPSDYTIKGNERSMKFHTDDSAGYERTIADVWFNSVEAAEKAGFTRAQR